MTTPVKVRFDIDAAERRVQISAQETLAPRPVVFGLSFAIIKALAAEVLMTESQLEQAKVMTVTVDAGKLQPAPPPQATKPVDTNGIVFGKGTKTQEG